MYPLFSLFLYRTGFWNPCVEFTLAFFSLDLESGFGRDEHWRCLGWNPASNSEAGGRSSGGGGQNSEGEGTGGE